ncbi:MAG: hypothetical protein IH869_05770 [Chloroflexi bacterium]|nr:hypothetical protein [Chloroflexota bacterium]
MAPWPGRRTRRYTSLESGRLVIGDGGQPVGGTRAAGETIASVVAELAKGR